MGERGNGLSDTRTIDVQLSEAHLPEEPQPTAAELAEQKPAHIEHEIEAVREELTELVDELDRRRHKVMDLPRQVRNSGAVIVAGVAGLLLIGTVATVVYRRRQRAMPLGERAQKVAQALAIISRDPDRLIDLLEQRPPSRGASWLNAALKIATPARLWLTRPYGGRPPTLH